MLLILSLLSQTLSSNMNGDIYGISNPDQNSKTQFSTVYSDINSKYEYFDVYSPPISTRYGDVYWTMMDSVNLPQNITQRFDNKVMAIVGYEQDQVFRTPDGDISVPITWAYNHHYEAFLQGKNAELVQVIQDDKNDYGAYNHGAKRLWKVVPENTSNIPNNQFFSEGNGGESRVSFHGYPRNTAQLIYSPRIFRIQPMQIDTRNRDPKYINDSVFHAGILPNRSAAPEGASYSGLLECPCTTRINKTIVHNYNALTSGFCPRVITNNDTCYQQAVKLGGMPVNNFTKIIQSKDYPEGCSIIQNNQSVTTDVILNNYNSRVKCGSDVTKFDGFMTNDPVTNVSLRLNIDKHFDMVSITMKGPADVWFGVGFNAKSMGDLPYTIIVNGSGGVFENKLGNHIPGQVLGSSIHVLENNVSNNIRTVVLTRNIEGLNSNYYTFNTDESTIPIITASGYARNFAYHKLKSANSIELKSSGGTTCICDDGISGFINGIPFSKRCAPEPTGDLVEQKNPSCSIETYQGGLSCCHHKNVLLDVDQTQPDHVMTYQLKFRFWFEEYNNHESLTRLYYQTEAYSGEYDIPKCPEGIPSEECVHMITAHWPARNMVSSDNRGNSSGVKLIYAGPHCHAPACISMELYNADTGDLICGVDGRFGQGRQNKTFDEKGYIKINPCVWGYEDGLLKPPYLSWDTNLTSIKRNNNTNAHYGEMASWQMRGVLVN